MRRRWCLAFRSAAFTHVGVESRLRYGRENCEILHYAFNSLFKHDEPFQQDRGILYATSDVPTAVAEFFQRNRRRINRFRHKQWLASFTLPLAMLVSHPPEKAWKDLRERLKTYGYGGLHNGSIRQRRRVVAALDNPAYAGLLVNTPGYYRHLTGL